MENFIEKCNYYEYIGRIVSDYFKGYNTNIIAIKRKLSDKIRSSNIDLNEIFYTKIVDRFIEFKLNNPPDAKFELSTPFDMKSMKLIITIIYRNVLMEILDHLHGEFLPVTDQLIVNINNIFV